MVKLSLAHPVLFLGSCFAAAVGMAHKDPAGSKQVVLKKSWRELPTRIVGGELVEQGGLPYQISLRFLNKHICGGSLVLVRDTQLVVTAAHCVQFKDPKHLTMVAGEVNQIQETGNEQTRMVWRIIPHEHFDPILGTNDIALLVPSYPYQLNYNVAPISLPKHDQKTEGLVLASGWGWVQEDLNKTSDYLLKVLIKVVDFDTCKQLYARAGEYVSSSYICAGNVEDEGRNTCRGDSGGPLVALEGEYLAGIDSQAIGCGRQGFPGLFTQVSQFIDWVEGQEARLQQSIQFCHLLRLLSLRRISIRYCLSIG